MKIKPVRIALLFFYFQILIPSGGLAVHQRQSPELRAIDLHSIDVKTYRKANGKKLNFIERFVIKRIQKRAKKLKARAQTEYRHNYGADALFYSLGGLALLGFTIVASIFFPNFDAVFGIALIASLALVLIGFIKGFQALKQIKNDPEKKGLVAAIIALVVGGIFLLWLMLLSVTLIFII